MATCPACLGERSSPAEVTAAVSVRRCSRCGHRVAQFRGLAPVEDDFLLQDQSDQYREALKQTRVRQARWLLTSVRRELGSVDGLLDFGCGRGWFLEVCKAEGLTQLAGADTSGTSIAAVQALGVEAVAIREPLRPAEAVGRLPFRPQVVVLLDVVEHLPPERVADWIAELLGALKPELRLAVIKVPISSGILYRAATVLAKARVTAPLDQLYQVGRTPPHVNYFSVRSMQALLRRLNVSVVRVERDPEFDPEGLSQRAPFLQRVPAKVAAALGKAAVGVATALRMQDTAAFLCRV